MTKKIFNLGEPESTHTCGHDYGHGNESLISGYSSSSLVNVNINETADNLVMQYIEAYDLDYTDQDIKYIPVIFKVTYEPTEETDVAVLRYNVQKLVDRCNLIFSGEYVNKGYNQGGNWETPLNSPHHGVDCKVRFFLPWKIPKDMVYPFQQIIDDPNYDRDPISMYTSLQHNRDRYREGIEFPDDRDQLYRSNYSYEEIKNKRAEVIEFNLQGSLELPEAVTELAAMEQDYFFFLGQNHGLMLIPLFEDLGGFMMNAPGVPISDPDAWSYHIKAILSNQQQTVVNTMHTDKLYERKNQKTIPSSDLLNKIPAVTFNGYGYTESDDNYLGDAFLGGMFQKNPFSKNVNLTSILGHTGGADLSKFYNSVVLHEFFHLLGYGHSFDGMSISGKTDFARGSSFNDYFLVSPIPVKRRFIPGVDFNNFYLPFSPPFKTYDPSNETHSLEDTESLPDFEEIDPNEKLFVEAAINQLIESTEGFKNGSPIVVLSSSTSTHLSTVRLPTQYTPVSGSIKEERNVSRFASIAHLPTFWGGSYTINADGTKSMLINPSTVVSVEVETPVPALAESYTIGDVINGLPATKHMPRGGSGYVYHIDEANKNVHIVSSKFVNMATYNTWTTMLANADNSAFAEGWELPDVTEVRRVNTNLYSEGLIPTVDDNRGFETAIRNGNSYWTSDFADRAGAWYKRVYFDLENPWGMNNRVYDAHTNHQNSGFIIYKHYYGDETATETETVDTVTRKGPNITVYNPVCDKNDPTKFNWGLPFSLDWYNDEYPAFPDNTRVEDMFSPELCPCLYETQNIYNVVKDVEAGFGEVEGEDVSVKLFEPLIDEITGETITTTTGNIVESPEVAKLSNLYIKPKGNQSSLSRANVSGLGAFYASSKGYSGVYFYDYFGKYNDSGEKQHPRVWLKKVGGITLPHFPVYIGFMPESPLPAAFKYDAIKIDEDLNKTNARLDVTNFSIVSDINDPSVYNAWGYDFKSITDKYLRIGSSDPTSDKYNPFKLDLNAAGIKTYITGEGYSVQDFENWYTAEYEDDLTGKKANSLNFESFYHRLLPNTTSPALDLIGDTLHGPVNQNTFANMMYYNAPKVEPVLPSKGMVKRLNYLASLDEGPLAVCSEYAKDMFDVVDEHSSILPDNSQKISISNTFQPYLEEMFDFVYSQRIPYFQLDWGCNDPSALNYSESVTANDGSCIEKVFGCMDQDAANYNVHANVDDGSCEFYSLVPTPTTKIYVCPSEITGACNNYSGETLLLDIMSISLLTSNKNIEFQVAPNEESLRINSMLNRSDDSRWKSPEGIAIFNKYRYSGGDCPTPLGSESEGTLNQGGGCVRIFDPTACVYPDLYRYNCNMLSDVSFDRTDVTTGATATGAGLGFSILEFIDYFQALSEKTDITIGTCDLENNESDT